MIQLEAYKEFISNASNKYAIDPKLIGAVIMQESAGQAWSYRYEPAAKYQHMASSYAKKLGISFDTELVMQHTSFGLMHIIGFKAREIGFDSHLPQLLLPSIGIEWGTKALAGFLKRYPTQEDAIASYNAGSPRKEMGRYVNQKYVDSVKYYLDQIKKDWV
jgi:soluble lytic murein transglycosylase-like protein